MFFSRLFRLESIYNRKYLPALVLDAVYPAAGLLLALAAATALGQLAAPWLILPLLILLDSAAIYAAWRVTRSVYADHVLAARRYQSAANAIERSVIHDELHGPSGRWFHAVDIRSGQVAKGEAWQIYDVLCDTYSRQLNFRYKSKQSFYTVFEAELHRPVPHFIFDAKLIRDRRTRRIYDNGRDLFLSRRLRHFFACRTSADRRVEIAGLLTPEVQQALCFLKTCDIELIGKTLFCYAPLLSKERLDVFRANSQSLQASLNRALAANKAGWRPHGKSRLERRLLKRPSVYVPAVIASGSLLLVLSLIATVGRETRLLTSMAVCGFVFLYTGGSLARTAQRNRLLLRRPPAE